MLDSSTYLLETARSLVLNPKDPPTWSILAGHSRTVSDSIKSLITSIRFVLIPPVIISVSAAMSSKFRKVSLQREKINSHIGGLFCDIFSAKQEIAALVYSY